MRRAPLLLFALFFCLVGTLCSVDAATFVATMSGGGAPLKLQRPWEECVGSGHAALALRQDWRAHLATSRTQIGFKRVRFHGILDDDMSAYLNGAGNYFNIDSVFDYLQSIGMKPIIEIGFMPEELASTSDTVFHYKGNISPPKDYAKFDAFVRDLVSHLVNRYGADGMMIEVWNEPNCGFFAVPNCCGDGCGDKQKYFELYHHVSRAVKSVNANVMVGGPATAQTGWISEFAQYIKQSGDPVDFVTTHLYPTDPLVPNTRTGFEDTLAAAADIARTQLGKPLVVTEFNSGLGLNQADTQYTAAFLGHLVLSSQELVRRGIPVLSFWTFTDIFEEGGFDSTPFASKFGLQTIYGVAKPGHRALEIIHHLQDNIALLSTQGNVDVVVTQSEPMMSNNRTSVAVLLVNYNRFGLPVQTEPVHLEFDFGLVTTHHASVPATVDVFRIDSTHVNPMSVWLKQGRPQYPTVSQIAATVAAAEFVGATLPLTPVTNPSRRDLYAMDITMEAQSVAVVFFDYFP